MLIQVGIPEPLRHDAAALYIKVFRQKLTPILGDDVQGHTLLAKGLVLEYGIAALVDDKLVGLAGIHAGQHHFATLRPFDLIQTFGWWSGLKRLALGILLERSAGQGELVLDGIAVDSEWRSQGVGTALLEAVVAYARHHHYRTVRLDVVDNNPAATRLYQRLGFMTMHTRRTGWLTRRLGFSAVTTMVKLV